MTTQRSGPADGPGGGRITGGLFGRGQEARAQALALAGTLTLPLMARSLTEKEVARIDGRIVPILLGIYGAVALPLLAMLAWEEGTMAEHDLAIAAPAVLAMGAGLWLFGRSRGRRRRDYRDPQIVLEVNEASATLRSPGRVDELDYAEASVAFKIHRQRGITYFLGLVLESPLGPLKLDDLWFKPGRTAGAAVAGRLEARGVLPAVR